MRGRFFLLAACCLVPVTAFSAPLINDVTTTPDDPPVFKAAAALPQNRGRDMAYPPAFAAVQKKHYPALAPLILKESRAEAFQKVLRAARSMPRWRVLSADESAAVLEAVAVTRILRFKDDVVVQVRSGPGGGSEIHMRSKSRLGRGDLGANAARIADFFSILSPQRNAP